MDVFVKGPIPGDADTGNAVTTENGTVEVIRDYIRPGAIEACPPLSQQELPTKGKIVDQSQDRYFIHEFEASRSNKAENGRKLKHTIYQQNGGPRKRVWRKVYPK
jgi:hypothetical protein